MVFMKKRNVLETSFMCLLFLAIVSPVQAQNKSIIRGIIVDSIKKEEISSANIMVYKHDSILVANAGFRQRRDFRIERYCRG